MDLLSIEDRRRLELNFDGYRIGHVSDIVISGGNVGEVNDPDVDLGVRCAWRRIPYGSRWWENTLAHCFKILGRAEPGEFQRSDLRFVHLL
jgi:hypothetical protein